MTKRIKILFTIPNFDTAGSGKVVYDLVKGLDKTIFAPEICCLHDKGAFFETVRALEVPIHLFAFTTPYRPFVTFPIRVYKIVQFFKSHKFDLIHSWHWSSDFSEPLAAKLAGIPFVYTKKSMGWGNKAWVWRSKLSSKIIVINSDMLPQFFNKMANKVVSIPLGVDISYFNPLKKRYTTPEHLNFSKADFVIVTIANLVPVKGIEVLLEAVIRLNDFSVKTLVIGDYKNDYGENLKRTYESKQILFLGKQQDIRPYLAVSDVFIIPTKDEGRKEGLPIAPLEAMASERLVLGSNISGIHDILAPFPECLFKPDDVVDLARCIKEIQSLSDENQKRLSLVMRKRVEHDFNLDTCVIKHESLYRTLIKN